MWRLQAICSYVVAISILFRPTMQLIAGGDDKLRAGCTKKQGFETKVQWPTNVKDKEERYGFNKITGIYQFDVHKDDKPFKEGSQTQPRTEVRIVGEDYSSGIRMFEGKVLVAANNSGACLTQIRPYHRHTLTMVFVREGNLVHYNKEVLATGIYGLWQHLLIRHNVEEGTVEHFVNDTLVLTSKLDLQEQKAAAPFYFKFGVYLAKDGSASSVVQVTWKDIALYDCTPGGQNQLPPAPGPAPDVKNPTTHDTHDHDDDNEENDDGDDAHDKGYETDEESDNHVAPSTTLASKENDSKKSKDNHHSKIDTTSGNSSPFDESKKTKSHDPKNINEDSSHVPDGDNIKNHKNDETDNKSKY